MPTTQVCISSQFRAKTDLLGSIHTGRGMRRPMQANGTCWCECGCPHCTQAISKEKLFEFACASHPASCVDWALSQTDVQLARLARKQLEVSIWFPLWNNLVEKQKKEKAFVTNLRTHFALKTWQFLLWSQHLQSLHFKWWNSFSFEWNFHLISLKAACVASPGSQTAVLATRAQNTHNAAESIFSGSLDPDWSTFS